MNNWECMQKQIRSVIQMHFRRINPPKNRADIQKNFDNWIWFIVHVWNNSSVSEFKGKNRLFKMLRYADRTKIKGLSLSNPEFEFLVKFIVFEIEEELNRNG